MLSACTPPRGVIMPESHTPGLGLTQMLAHFAADLRYGDLPSEAVATLKKLFLDTVATALAGTTLGAGCAEVMQVVRAAAGTPEYPHCWA